MTEREQDRLIERATTAWRPRDLDGGVRFHPAFHDLDAAGRQRLFEQIQRQRQLEAAVDDDGLSTTAHAVLARIRRAAGPGTADRG